MWQIWLENRNGNVSRIFILQKYVVYSSWGTEFHDVYFEMLHLSLVIIFMYYLLIGFLVHEEPWPPMQQMPILLHYGETTI
jgi:hypothetical protein